jgi:hypothetical protein
VPLTGLPHGTISLAGTDLGFKNKRRPLDLDLRARIRSSLPRFRIRSPGRVDLFFEGGTVGENPTAIFILMVSTVQDFTKGLIRLQRIYNF